MDDRDVFDMELSPGDQPPAGMGDRLLVGIAAIALVGGLAIAVLNAVHNSEAAKASPTPSVAPRRTPIPVPTPQPARVATLESPDVELAQPSFAPSFSGWVRALTDIAIVSSPSTNATRVGVLATDSAVYADQQGEPADEPGWLHIDTPGGWIATIKGGEPLVRRYEWPQYRSSGWVNSLAAGKPGVVAMVTPVNDANQYLPAAPVVSTDGVTWQSGGRSAFGSWEPGALTWGPAGWLAVAQVSDANSTDRFWAWSSTDGSHWTPPGMLAGMEGEYPNQLVASNRGYLLLTGSNSRQYNAGTFWSSPDGRTWTESKDPLLRTPINGELRIKGLPNGYYIWDENTQPFTGPRFAAFSTDGLTWRHVAGAQDSVNLQLAAVGGSLVAIDADQRWLTARVWHGTVARGQVVWTRRVEAEPPFAGAVVTQLVSDGTRLYAFGWNRANDRALVWTSSGESWTRTELPASYGGIPQLAAAWPGGAVVVGHRPDLRGDNPIFWHRTATGAWLPESKPILPYIPDPSSDDCPALPADFLEFAMADTAGLLACHGSAPITFRAWSAKCDQCWGYDPSLIATPAWLLQPTSNQLFLNPIETTDGGYWSGVTLTPDLTVDPSWRSAWVEVTGHYDDPASATCHREPTVDDIRWWSGQQSIITQCRQTFVVTAVKVVNGP